MTAPKGPPEGRSTGPSPVPQGSRAPARSTLPVAGLERRFYAYAVDRALEVAFCSVAGLSAWWGTGGSWLAVTGAVVLTGLLLATLVAVMVGSAAATPGKRLLGLRLVDHASGSAPTFGRAWLRTVLLGLASIPTAGFGVSALAMTVLADPAGGRRGWHDLRTGTVVVDIRPLPGPVEQEVEAPRQVVNLTALRLAPVDTSAHVGLPPPVSGGLGGAQTGVQAGGPTEAQDRPSAGDAPEQTVVRGAPKAPEPVPPPAPPGPPVRWRLTVDTGETLLVEGDALLGRSPAAGDGEHVRHLLSLASHDMSVSKTHAQVGLGRDGSLVVVDRGSTNGSLLLRQGVTREIPTGQPTTLVAGDRIRLGDRELLVSRET